MKKLIYEFATFNKDQFQDYDLININEILPLHTDHIAKVGESMFTTNKPRYISIEQWLVYSLYNDNLIGSRAHCLKKLLPINAYCFNTSMTFGEKIEITQQPIEVDTCDETFVTIEYNLYNWFFRKHLNLINNLIKLKIIYNSFFLREIIHMVKIPYNINSDFFFENFDTFKEFARDYNIDIDILDFEKTTFINDFYKLITPQKIETNYILYNTELFVNKMICNGKIPNGHLVYIPKPNLQQEDPFPRTLTVYSRPEPYTSSYDIYMYKVLRLYPNNLSGKMLKYVYAFLMKSEHLPTYIHEKSRNSLMNLKSKVSVHNDTLCYEDHLMFLINSTQSLNRIKNHCFHHNVKEFYVYNVKSCKIEFIKIQPRVKESHLIYVEF
jgi:hypothetical protein